MEDTSWLRELIQRGLQARGYTVLAAAHGEAAIQLAGAHPGTVHLLVADLGLPGIGGRRLAERGAPPEVMAELLAAVADGEDLLAKGHLTEADIDRWSRLNERFHRAIVESAGSRVVADAIARNNHLPFASADSLVIDREALDREYHRLHLAQMQHQLIVDALQRRESARVEMLMREHAYIALRYGRLFGLAERISGNIGGQG